MDCRKRSVERAAGVSHPIGRRVHQWERHVNAIDLFRWPFVRRKEEERERINAPQRRIALLAHNDDTGTARSHELSRRLQ